MPVITSQSALDKTMSQMQNNIPSWGSVLTFWSMLASPNKIQSNPLVSGKTEAPKDEKRDTQEPVSDAPAESPSSVPQNGQKTTNLATVPIEFDIESNLALRPSASIKAAYLTWFGKVFPEFASATASLALMTAAMRPAYVVQPLSPGTLSV